MRSEQLKHLDKISLVYPPFCCIVHAASDSKFESTLDNIECSDPTMCHEQQTDGGLWMIFGSGELHLEVILHKLRHDHDLIFKLLRGASAILLEPWMSLEIKCSQRYAWKVKAELQERGFELDPPLSDVITGNLPAGNTIGLFDKLKELTEASGSYSSEFCEYRMKLDWTVKENG